MNSVSLIPFVVGLIGFDQCVKDSPDLWKFGPEYNFVLNASGSFEVEPPNHLLGSNVSAIIKCRPFSSKAEPVTEIADALRCHVNTSAIDNFHIYKIPAKITRDGPPGNFQITDFTFDIIYGKNQVEEIKIHQPIYNFKMNVYRDIVSQLNLAFTDFRRENARFAERGYETSTLGNCDTKFEIFKRVKYGGKTWTSPCKNMHLEVFGSNYPSVMLEKTRNLSNCTILTPYFFGEEDNTIRSPGFTAKTNTSVSGIIIAPQNFESHTIRVGSITTAKKTGVPTEYAISEEVSLRLVSIEPATGRFEPMVTYGVTRIFANDPVEEMAANRHARSWNQ